MSKQQQPKKKKTIPVQQKFVLQKLDFRWPIVIALIAFGLFVNTLNHGYVLDDSVSIVNNQFVQQGVDGIGGLLKVDLLHFNNLSLGYYRPLSLITFAIEHEIFGSNPQISHFINVLLYSFAGFMLCLLLMELFQGYHKLFVFFICLLFIAHPVHTEVVANLKSRDELMSFIGIISMLFIMFRYDGSRKKIYLISAFIIYYLALLSKETAVTGAVLLPVTLYFFKRNTIFESIRKSIPFIFAVLLFFFHKHQVLGTSPDFMFKELNNYPYTQAKLSSSMVLFSYYVKLLIFPHPLNYDYSYNQIPAGSISNPLTLLGFVMFCTLIYFAIRGFNNRTIWGFALAVFFVCMMPAIGFVWLKGGVLTERFLNVASLGYCIVFVYFTAKLFKVDFRKWNSKQVPITAQAKDKTATAEPTPIAAMMGPGSVVILVALALSFKTMDRNKAWKSNITLYSTDVVNAPNSCQTNRHYGHELLEAAIVEKDTTARMNYFFKSLYHLNKAVTINPRFGEAWGDLGRAYSDVRFIPDSAIYFYKRCIQATPGAAITHSNLGLIYLALQKYELASYYFNRAIEINPTFKDAREHSARLKKATGLDVHVYPGGEDPKYSSPEFMAPGQRR